MDKTFKFQQCSKTVMDNLSDPNISFDGEGVSNYWYDYQKEAELKLLHGDAGRKKWDSTVELLKTQGKGKKYDCIIGVSGGVDSSYIAYMVKEAKLRPLVVHFDNGWNSEIAVQNISKIIEYLDADLHTLVIDWEEFRDMQRAYLLAGVVDIEALTDHAIIGTLYKVAAKYGVKSVLSGSNVETEAVLPRAWIFNKLDHINIIDIHSKFGSIPISTYPIFDSLKKKYYLKFKKLNFIAPINWISYNKEKVKEILIKEIGWTDYGGKHHESVFTKFYQNHILPVKFGIDKRKAHLSNLICSGQISKDAALGELAMPLYGDLELINDREYVIKKLGFSEDEFEEILKQKPKSHREFKTEGPIDQEYPFLKPVKMIYKLLRK